MSEVHVTVSGPVGSGKSAIAGEIEIALRAIGVPVRFSDQAAMQSEKNMTHADWQMYIDMYKPSVVISEVIAPAGTASVVPADADWSATKPDLATTAATIVCGQIHFADEDLQSRLHGAVQLACADAIAQARREALEEAWQPIETLVPNDDLVLASCPPDADFPKGRMMIWKASMLVRNRKGPTPWHLQFPASHWHPLPAPPSASATPQDRETGDTDG